MTAAQTAKPTNKPKRKPTRKTVKKLPNPKTASAAILTLTATTPATPSEIAESVNTSRQHVHQVLKRYGIEPNTAESFKKHRADILAGMQERILKTIDMATINNASLMQRGAAIGILYDKERLERGLSTDNIAYDARTVTTTLSELREMLAQVRSGADVGEDQGLESDSK